VGGTRTTVKCTVAGFLEESYGKYPDLESQVIMEYGQFTSLLSSTLPPTGKILNLYHHADMFMVTLPQPRYAYYQNTDFD